MLKINQSPREEGKSHAKDMDNVKLATMAPGGEAGRGTL